MITINDKPHINADTATFILKQHTERGGVFIDLDRAIDYRTFFIEGLRPKLAELIKDSADASFELKPDKLYNTMKYRFGENLDVFRVNLKDPTSKLTAEKKVIKARIEKNLISKDAVEFIGKYYAAMEFKTAANNLKSYINLPLMQLESFEGHRMVLAKPNWHPLNTGRIGCNNPNIQSLSRMNSDLVTYPEGWILVRADSGQIEPRITYSVYIRDALLKQLIIIYDDAYYGMLHYILMSQQEERYYRENISMLKPMDVTTKDMIDLRDDLKKLLLIGNYGGNLDAFDPKLAEGFMNKIQKHPDRKRWEAEVRRDVANGVKTFYSYFGTPITPGSTGKYEEDTDDDEYSSGASSWEAHLIRCGINNPIQATAADLMCESVYYQDKLLREESSGKSWIGFYKHDESLTYLHKSDEHLMDEIAGCTSYQVLDWIPINSDIVVGIKKPKHDYDYQLTI